MRHLLLAGLIASPFALAEPATLLRDSELRAKPQADAAVIAPLQAQSVVEVSARQGAWAQVKTPTGQSGWVRVLNLRTGSGRRGDAGIGAMASVFRTGSSGNTVSTGVKGLSAEQISQAAPNEAEVARLATLAVKEADARQFASQGKLASQSVDYLPDAEPQPAKKRRK